MNDIYINTYTCKYKYGCRQVIDSVFVFVSICPFSICLSLSLFMYIFQKKF